MDNLSSKECIPCSIGAPTLDLMQIKEYLDNINKEWQVKENKYIERIFKFKNFKEALDFTNKVGNLAEEEGHHPDIYLSWGRVVIKLWTHKIGGLHENDFILAAKVDLL